MRTFQRAPNLPAETAAGGDLLIVDADRDFFFSANSVGAFIWKKLKSPMSIEEISQSVSSHFSGGSDQEVQSDVAEFVHALCEHGVVEAMDKDPS